MGKDLSGKELGNGITQRKNGTYQARYVDRWGKRKTINEKDLRKLRVALAEAIASNANYTSVKEDITLDAWYDRWIAIYKDKRVRPNTKQKYSCGICSKEHWRIVCWFVIL